jgi:hypothetical protein
MRAVLFVFYARLLLRAAQHLWEEAHEEKTETRHAGADHSDVDFDG